MSIHPYPGEEQRERELDALAARAGASVITIGASVEGRPIRMARVPAADPTVKASVLVVGNIHGVEWIGSRVAMGVLRACGERTSGAASLLQRAHVLVLPCMNVDGYARTERQDGQGTWKQLRCNAHGVDLNRNFPMPHGAKPSWMTIAGSSDPARSTWRGEAPLSEPEARAVAEMVERERPHASVSYHSFMGTLIPPKVLRSSDVESYRALCRAYRSGQTGPRYPRLQNRFVDVFTGELEDHLHHRTGCWALTVEIFPLARTFAQHLRAPAVFWRFNPHNEGPWVDNEVGGTLAFFDAALSQPRPRSQSAVRPAEVGS